jgi:predicted PurR-regulated permease PerM
MSEEKLIDLPPRIALGARAKRVVALLVFLVLVALFRELAVIGVVFVATSAGLGGLADQLAARARLSPRAATGIVFGAVAVLIAVLLFLGVSRSLHAYSALAHGGLKERIAAVQSSETVKRVEELDIDVKPALAWLEGFGAKALGALRLSGEILLHALIGFLIALVYRIDQKEVDEMVAAIDPRSIAGNVLRYAGFLGEAVVAALKLQVAVALVNAALTGLVIFALSLPGAPTLIALVFLFGLMPVVGNILSGTMLVVLSYLHHGAVGPIVFVISTFVLHKLESFYLNPRLTRKHVHLPPLAIIVSLIAFEHLFGVVGLFLSFPTIYLGIRIVQHFRSAEGAPAV